MGDAIGDSAGFAPTPIGGKLLGSFTSESREVASRPTELQSNYSPVGRKAYSREESSRLPTRERLQRGPIHFLDNCFDVPGHSSSLAEMRTARI